VDADERAALESTIAKHWRRGEWSEAATAAIRGYGPEILGFLLASTRREQDASDVFSLVCEDVWCGLSGFRYECTFRTWMHAVARRALARAARDGARRRKRVVLPADVAEIEQIAEQVRTRTLPFLRTEARDEIARLREELPDDDRMLLVLRIDRRMRWDAIARVMFDETDGDPTPAELSRLATTLRKRFERTKDRLRRAATAIDDA
jgi:RNA polymerase sigma-70 factor (ECF subfamily)